MRKTFFHITFLALLAITGTSLKAQDSLFEEVDYMFDQEAFDTLSQEPAPSVELKTIDRDVWKKSIEGLDYNENIPKKEKREKEAPASKADPETVAGIATFMKYLLIIIGVGLILFILYKLVEADSIFGRTDKKLADKDIAFAENADEEELLKEELVDYIKKAEAAQNYKVAVRLRYLDIIQKLNDKQIIRWKKEKTNLQYYREILDGQMKAPFKIVTRHYEDVWFGDRSIDSSQYNLMVVDFSEMQKHIQTQPSPA
ncbi:MAG: DUF4129 domain-containing protein [Saprospiraceae bacterium]